MTSSLLAMRSHRHLILPLPLFMALLSCVSLRSVANEPNWQRAFDSHCVDCHSSDEAKAGIRLDNLGSGETTGSQETLERALAEIRNGSMPPADYETITTLERQRFATNIHDHLLNVCNQERPSLRGLTRREYEQSIRSVFGISFDAPASLPQQIPTHGFDNQIDSLILSSPLLEAYYESATQIADRLLPPPSKRLQIKTTSVPPGELVISYSSGALINGALRLAAKTDPMWRSCTWPQNFEAQQAGTYRLEITASQFGRLTKHWGEFEGVMKLQIRARSLNDKDGDGISKQRLLAEFGIDSSEHRTMQAIVELYPNETPVLYFANAPIDGVKGTTGPFGEALRRMFAQDQRLLAGWQRVKHGNGLRGGIGWDRVKKIRDSKDLDLSEVDTSSEGIDKVIAKMCKNPGLYAETVVYQFYEEGPALEIHDLIIEGPLSVTQDQKRLDDLAAAEELFQVSKLSEDSFTTSPPFLAPFLSSVFRRPATEAEIKSYQLLALGHVRSGHSAAEAVHLILRTALVSPHFLLREHKNSITSQFELANRLSYFLTGGPADRELNYLAESGKLKNTEELEQQSKRLLESNLLNSFIEDFTGQWLRTHELSDIMPDPRLFPSISEAHIASMRKETQLFFEHALSNNLPLEHLIAPEFSFIDRRLAEDVYKLTDFKGKAAFKKTLLPADSPFGGLLGQASIMMATANGVDTQPVVRGTWVLENILGTPPPPPPENVPALTPDTSSAQTLKEQMLAHQSDDNCASCHRKIDPLGFVLENFDAVGSWRTHYQSDAPKGKKNKRQKLPVESQVQFLDGAEFKDVRDLKAYIVKNIDQFGNCLAGKFLSYATGRRVDYRDGLELKTIVSANLDDSGGLKDLLLAVILSDAFRR